MALTYSMQIDALDINDENIAIGLSNLEGNIWNGSIQILKLNTGEIVSSQQSDAALSDVKFLHSASKHESLILSARDDGFIGVYQSNLENASFIDAHNGMISSLAIPSHFNDDISLFSTGYDSQIIAWDLSTLKPVHYILNAHTGPVIDACSFEMSAHGSALVSVGYDGYARIWDFRVGSYSDQCVCIFNLGYSGSCVTIDKANNNMLISGNEAGEITCHDIRAASSGSYASDPLICTIPAHKLRVRKVKTSANRPNIIVSCSDDTTIGVFGNRATSASLNSDLYTELDR